MQYTFLTFLILIVAVFQDRIRAYLSRPRLRVLVNLAPPDCQQTLLTPPQPVESIYQRIADKEREFQKEKEDLVNEGRVKTHFDDAKDRLGTLFEKEKKLAEDRAKIEAEALIEAHYFRIRVENYGRGRAELVEVYAAELWRQQEDGTSVKVDKFVPVGLLWSHIEKAFYPSLSPGMEKPCDLGWISDPRRRSHEENTKLNISSRETAFVFNVEAKTHTLSNVIPPGRYHLKLIVTAANSKPTAFILEIELSGRWFPNNRDMLDDGIKIKLVKEGIA